MLSRRWIAVSKLGASLASRSAVPGRLLSAMLSSRAHRLDSSVGLAACELDAEAISDGDAIDRPHQSTVGAADQAIAPLQRPLRRQRAQVLLEPEQALAAAGEAARQRA